MQDIEFAQIESQVIAGLKTGNESLKKMHEVIKLGCVCNNESMHSTKKCEKLECSEAGVEARSQFSSKWIYMPSKRGISVLNYILDKEIW